MTRALEEYATKVPAVTLGFWIIKIAATTLGETGGDTVTMTLHWGYLAGTALFAALLVGLVIAQIVAKKFHPFLYWATIIASTTFGTTMADFADRSLGIGYTGGSLLLFVSLLSVLGLWYWSQGSVSVATVGTPRVEAFYWATITLSQTLGTALGDWTADSTGLGYQGGTLVFGLGIAAIAAIYYWTNVSRVLLFWAAFILTRPLGATVGDFLDKPVNHGGLALSRPLASLILAMFIVGCILAATGRQTSGAGANSVVVVHSKSVGLREQVHAHYEFEGVVRNEGQGLVNHNPTVSTRTQPPSAPLCSVRTALLSNATFPREPKELPAMGILPRFVDADEGVQKAPAILAVGITGFAFLFGASTWAPNSAVHELIENLGRILIVVHAVGRAWCWNYAHPVHKGALITTGPYSICRHPQDFFLILGGIGIAALLGSFSGAVAGGLVTWAIACLRLVEEERLLRATYGDKFQSYRKRVPKFIPNLSLWQRSDPALFRRAPLFIGILKAWPLGGAVVVEAVIEKLHVMHKMPVLFHML